jgi:O-antigen/teichoic acid export membrane protein
MKKLISWRPGELARNTAHASFWNVARILLQASSLILMARLFGSSGYGALAGTVSLYTTFAQFAGLGSGIALVRHLARVGQTPYRLLATQVVYFATSIMLFILIWPTSVIFLRGTMTPATLAFLALAELVIAPALLPTAYRYQAEERMSMSGAVLTIPPFARFAAVSAALLLGMHDISRFAPLYLGCLSTAVIICISIARPIGRINITLATIGIAAREGLPYVISGAAMTAGNELDKTILLRDAGAQIAGPYAASYRIMQAVTLPVNSLILAASARMFRSSETNNASFNKSLLWAVFFYAVTAATILWFLAPFVHVLLGADFLSSEEYLRGLCMIVITNCLRQLVTAQLTTQDFQRFRNMVEIAGLVTFLSLLILLVPKLHAWGAIVALGFSDLLVITWASTHIFTAAKQIDN